LSIAVELSEERVSILVLVDVALKVREKILKNIEGFCFNPCFGGCRSERLGILSLKQEHMRVSILVLVDVALKEIQCQKCKTTYHWVSILVLVDVALKVQQLTSTGFIDICFNPCFGGCRSESWH